MKNINFNKKILILVSIILGLFVLGGCWNQENKKTIVNLGDGWKSYSHEEIGIAVKIPENAEAKYEIEGDKKEYPTVRFSNGPIVLAMSALNFYPRDDTYERAIAKYRKEMKENNGVWNNSAKDTKRGVESRDLYKEVKIYDKIVFIKFYESRNKKQNSHIFKIARLIIPGGTRVSSVSFSANSDNFYKQYPQLIQEDFSDEALEQSMQKHIDVVKDLIISIDNF